MLPPLPKKALKIATAAPKRVTFRLLKKKACTELVVGARGMSTPPAPGYLRRGKPYLTVRDRSVANAG